MSRKRHRGGKRPPLNLVKRNTSPVAEQQAAATAQEVVRAEKVPAAPQTSPADPFHMVIDNPGHTDAVCPVGWCVTASGAHELERRGILNPHMLILICTRDTQSGELHEVERILVPLEDRLCYISFPHQGEYEVFTSIVWSDKEEQHARYQDLHERVMRRYAKNSYSYDLLHFGKPLTTIVIPTVHLFGNYWDSERVTVGHEFFAKEPPRWLKWWVNYMWDGQGPRDQCDFRKRMIFAFTLQLVFFLPVWTLIMLVRGFLAAGCLIGARVDFKPLAHPLTMDTGDVLEGSFWTRSTEENVRGEREKRSFTWLALTPLLWICQTGLTWCSFAYGSVGESILSLLPSLLFIMGLFIVDDAMKTVLKRDTEQDGMTAEERERAAVEERRRAKVTAYYISGLFPAICSTDATPRTTQMLRPTKPPVRLRFQTFKARVCRPYSRG